MNVRNLLIACVFSLFSMTHALAQNDGSLEERMNQEEFRASGLEKLTAEELRFLNDWLNGRQTIPAPTPPQEPDSADSTNVGFRPGLVARETINSQIDGEFKGWLGKTTFKLTNGQVWRQVDGTTKRFNASNPSVRIEPKSMNSWKMYVEGLNRGVRVTRIK